MSIVHDLITYLKENFGDQKEILWLHSLSVSTPAPKPKPTLTLPPAPKKAVEKPLPKQEEAEPEEPPPSFITEKPSVTTTPIANEMQAIYQKIAPKMSLSEKPLTDDVAKQIR